MQVTKILNNHTVCACKDFVNKEGHGNCKQIDPKKKPTCYVEQPSNCKDLENSSGYAGEQYSSVACDQGIPNISRDLKIRFHIKRK